MEAIVTILTILFLHWFADFVLQTDWQAQNKSKSNKALTAHVFYYSMVWFIASVLFASHYDNRWMLVFSAITFVCHWVTDYFTSRLNSKLWNEKRVHAFFVSVGFDQFLHYSQLLITYYYLNTLN